MRYLIRLERDGCYFSGFNKETQAPEFGKIQDAKIYASKFEAGCDMERMGQYGQRIVACTHIGTLGNRKRNNKINA